MVFIAVIILSAVLSTITLIYSSGLNRSEWFAIANGIVKSGLAIFKGLASINHRAKAFKNRIEPTFGIKETVETAEDDRNIDTSQSKSLGLSSTISKTGLSSKFPVDCFPFLIHKKCNVDDIVTGWAL